MDNFFFEFFNKNNIKFQKLVIKDFIAYRCFEFTNIINVISFLKVHTKVRMALLIDLFCADFPDLDKRFEISYSFLSLKLNKRFLFKINIREDEVLGSIAKLFRNAVWYEREIFDMFGVNFDVKRDRILTDYGFKGYPLRKDFPLTGHVEIRYNDNMQKIIHEPVVLDQEFRDFDFQSSWAGPKDK